MWWRVKQSSKKVLGEDLDTLNKRLQTVQQIGWIVGIMIWVPAQLLYISTLIN